MKKNNTKVTRNELVAAYERVATGACGEKELTIVYNYTYGAALKRIKCFNADAEGKVKQITFSVSPQDYPDVKQAFLLGVLECKQYCLEHPEKEFTPQYAVWYSLKEYQRWFKETKATLSCPVGSLFENRAHGDMRPVWMPPAELMPQGVDDEGLADKSSHSWEEDHSSQDGYKEFEFNELLVSMEESGEFSSIGLRALFRTEIDTLSLEEFALEEMGDVYSQSDEDGKKRLRDSISHAKRGVMSRVKNSKKWLPLLAAAAADSAA